MEMTLVQELLAACVVSIGLFVELCAMVVYFLAPFAAFAVTITVSLSLRSQSHWRISLAGLVSGGGILLGGWLVATIGLFSGLFLISATVAVPAVPVFGLDIEPWPQPVRLMFGSIGCSVILGAAFVTVRLWKRSRVHPHDLETGNVSQVGGSWANVSPGLT
jgi:hypothetical protein